MYFKGSYLSIYRVNKSNAGMNNGSFIKLEFSAGRDSEVNNRQMNLLLVDLVEIPRGSVCISRGVIRAYIVFAICRVLQVMF